MVKNPPANAGDAKDMDLIPGLGRSPGVLNGNPLQYSCLENSMDRGALGAVVHGVTESNMTEHTHNTHTHTHAPLLQEVLADILLDALCCQVLLLTLSSQVYSSFQS